jgi:hypothetical protein
MRGIWAGPILTRESRRLALGLLMGQRLVSRMAFPAPPGARYAHKTGELGGVENDAGILLAPGWSFAVAVLVEGDVGRAAPPVSGALRVHCGFHAGTHGGRRAGPAWAVCMNIPRFCMQETSWPCVGMRGQLDNVSVPPLQCR